MAKKSEIPVIKCADCINASFVTTPTHDPRVIHCRICDQRKVADSYRKCSSFSKDKHVD